LGKVLICALPAYSYFKQFRQNILMKKLLSMTLQEVYLESMNFSDLEEMANFYKVTQDFMYRLYYCSQELYILTLSLN